MIPEAQLKLGDNSKLLPDKHSQHSNPIVFPSVPAFADWTMHSWK